MHGRCSCSFHQVKKNQELFISNPLIPIPLRNIVYKQKLPESTSALLIHLSKFLHFQGYCGRKVDMQNYHKGDH